MMTESIQSITTATRTVLQNWKPMLLVALVYAALLAALYSFLAVREASVAQVVVTFVLAIAAPLLFFMLQAMITGGPDGTGSNQSLGRFIVKALIDLWKLLLISLPLIALAVLIVYLLAKAQARLGSSLTETAAEIPRRLTTMANSRQPARPVDWKFAIVATVRYLMLGLFLPLAAIHLWLVTARKGLGTAIKRIGRLLAKAFAPRAVFIYVAGFIIFAVVPYFLLLRTIPSKHAWLELTLFIARLVVVFALTLFGWVITVKALALASLNPDDLQDHRKEA
jgi:hypothetical protein